MSIFSTFFKPYAEYNVSTTLTEDELKAQIEKHLPEEKFSATLKAMQNEDEVKLFRTAKPLVLSPYLYGNNTLRGIIHLQCNKSENPAENTLTITIAPAQYSFFLWIKLTFSTLLGIIPSIRNTGTMVLYLILWRGLDSPGSVLKLCVRLNTDSPPGKKPLRVQTSSESVVQIAN